MEVVYTPRFLRAIKKLPIHLRPTIEKRIILFQKDPFNRALKSHKLIGEFKDCWSFSIDYQYRIIFEFINDKKVVFHTAGDHSVY